MERFALTSLQRAMVLASLRSPGKGVYIVQDVCQISGDLDAAALKCAWQYIACRHAALRTIILFDPDGRPWQQVLDVVGTEWTEYDWGKSDYFELSAFLDADRERGFDFSAGPPLRIALVRMPIGQHAVIWSCHHVLMDARSFALLWKEWFCLYEAILRNASPEVSVASDFRDYLRWLAKRDWHRARSHWIGYLAGIEPGCGSVLDRLRPGSTTPSDGVARETFSFSSEASGDIRAFTERHQITINTLIQGAWALLLSRHLGRECVVFGAIRACRYSSIRGAAGMAGLMINTLPVRIDTSPETEVLPWLQQIRQNWLGQRLWEQTPIEIVQEASGLAPGESLFETVLSYETESFADHFATAEGWQDRKMSRVQRTDTPLTLVAYGMPVVRFELVYDTARLSKFTITSMVGHLVVLTEALVRNPEQSSACSACCGLTKKHRSSRLPGGLKSNTPANSAHIGFLKSRHGDYLAKSRLKARANSFLTTS